MFATASVQNRYAVHGLAVGVECSVAMMSPFLDRMLEPFLVDVWPPGFAPVEGTVCPYDQDEVLRHLSPDARVISAPGDAMEIYNEGERYWVIDDRWGILELNLIKARWRSWVLPHADDSYLTFERAVLWPMAQLLRAKGLHLVPAASVVRDGWGMLLVSQTNIEPELTALINAGFSVVGQRWTALREDEGRVAMLAMPGQVERAPGPRRRNATIVQKTVATRSTVEPVAPVEIDQRRPDPIQQRPSESLLNQSLATGTSFSDGYPIANERPINPTALALLGTPAIDSFSGLPTSADVPHWVDLIEENISAFASHAFCDTILLIEPTRRVREVIRPNGKVAAASALRKGWPIFDLRPGSRYGKLTTVLSEQARCFEATLSRRPTDLLQHLELLRYGRPVQEGVVARKQVQARAMAG